MTSADRSLSMLRAVRIAGPGSEFLMDDEPVDVVIEGDRITDIAPTGVLRPRGDVIDLHGAWAVPGLWDNHVHTVQWALASERVDLGGAESAAHAASIAGAVAPLPDGRRVGMGFRDALWADAPTLAALDSVTGEVPTYLINADVHSVWLNSAALRREDMRALDGMLREEEAFEISRRLNAVDPNRADQAVIAAGEQAARRGVTGVVDFDMAWNVETWPRRVAAGFRAHRVEFAVYPVDLARAIAAGMRTGDVCSGESTTADQDGLIRVGSLKIITDGSLGTRTAACSQGYAGDEANTGLLAVPPDQLTELLASAAGSGWSVAVHAIGDRAVGAALDAFTITGAIGSIEHAQLVRHADLARFARLGVIASVQPCHAVDDRDLADQQWRRQTSVPYPLRSLFDAEAEVRFGSDAPVAPLDPWQSIAAAVTRSGDAREPWHPEERVSRERALGASVRTAIRPGELADIAVCGLDPLTTDAADLVGMPVVATVLGGRLTHGF